MIMSLLYTIKRWIKNQSNSNSSELKIPAKMNRLALDGTGRKSVVLTNETDATLIYEVGGVYALVLPGHYNIMVADRGEREVRFERGLKVRILSITEPAI